MIYAILILAALAAAGYFFMPKGWRTVAMNIFVGLPFLFTDIFAYLTIVDWTAVFNGDVAFYTVILANVGNIVMRYLTDTAVGQKV